MNRFLIFLFLLFNTSIFAQVNCAGREIRSSNGNLKHFRMVSNCPYEETDTTKLPQLILDNSKKYLLDRVGASFYSRLQYYSCQVIDFKKYDEIKKTRPWIDKKSADKRVKYAIQYFFIVQDSMRYYLSLVFDKDGKVISDHFLPDKKTNENFAQLINSCSAIQIAEADSVFKGQAEEISLEYLPEENAFVWVVQKPVEYRDRTNIHPGIVINANTGKLVKRQTRKSVTACALPSW
ncbi:MAG: PepSY domain-containing protein [Bacteroidota bacterium]|nr:PepSY domain-containing protein [Bacteroidota bacterium]